MSRSVKKGPYILHALRIVIGIHGNLANLAGGQTHLSVFTLFGHQLRIGAGRTDHLAATAGLELHIVDQRTDGDVRDGQRVAGLDVSFGAGDHGIAHVQAQRRQDVALLAIRVVKQRDESTAVGIVLDRRHLGGDITLFALEVDDAVLDLVAAALMTNGDLSLAVAARILLQILSQALLGGLLGDLLESQHGHMAAGGRSRLINSNCHFASPPY